MAFINPQLSLRAKNRLLNNGGELTAKLTFQSMDDFKPINIIKKIPALLKLYESRVRLKDLISKLDGNESLDYLLQEIINDSKKRNRLFIELDLKKEEKLTSIFKKDNEINDD